MERKGICKNVGVCTMAGKVQVITDDDAELKCSECGEELEPYKEEPIPVGPNPKKKWIAIAAAIIVLAALGAGAYFLFGGPKGPTAIKLDKTELVMKVGETQVIVPTAEPEGVKVTFVFKKKGKNIEVTSGGEVTATKKGEATVLVKCEENPDIRAICKVKVEGDETIAEPAPEPQEPEVTEPETPAKEEPKAEEKKEEPKKTTTTTSKPQQPQNGQGTVNLGYGKYYGGLRNGQPDGTGKLTFTRSYQLNSEYTAQPGEYIQGIFENGKPSFVTYYKNDGTVVKIKLR